MCFWGVKVQALRCVQCQIDDCANSSIQRNLVENDCYVRLRTPTAANSIGLVAGRVAPACMPTAGSITSIQHAVQTKGFVVTGQPSIYEASD